MNSESRYIAKLKRLKEASNYRSLPSNSENTLIDLCSNDYLGLNANHKLYHKFIEKYQSKKLKFSAASSRLLSGNSAEYTRLEQLIASSYKRDACLLFNSGYHANIGILPALASKKDLIIADKLVHASIIDGTKLSQATLLRYKHLNYQHLESILQKQRASYDNVFIVSESIFSMDGDVVDIQKLVELKLKFKCYLYIDEAHALGTIGANGLGCSEKTATINNIDFIVGTFGKALASVGAFVVCSTLFKKYLVNHSRSFIFTTALPPINFAWTTFLFERLPDFNIERTKLLKISQDFAALLKTKPKSHIIPLLIGDNKEAIIASQNLKHHGFNALPIRYPTVPKGTARLRFSLNANLNIKHLLPLKKLLNNHE